MMVNNAPSPKSGEARHTETRKGYWRFQVVATIAMFAAVGAIGTVVSLSSDNRIPAFFAFAAAAAGVIGFMWFARNMMTRFDEVERQDNLWAAHFALAFFVSSYPLWHYLHDKGLVEFPKPRWMFFATCGIYLLTFLVRRLGWR